MRRIVIVGGRGFFGARIAERLSGAVTAGRSSGHLRIDVEDDDSIRTTLRGGDVVVDTAGPFQRRSMRLLDGAIEGKFDLIDISDSPEYCGQIYALEREIAAAGIRVLTACSSLSTVSAAVIAASGIEQPRTLTVRLIPASRYTANRGSATSMLQAIKAGAEARPDGVAVHSVDSVTLPRVWPTLERAEFVVDSGIPGVNAMLLIAARRPVLARAIEKAQPVMLPITRVTGRREGLITYTVDESRTVSFTGRNSFLVAVLPAVLAARALASNQFIGSGLIPPNRHVDREVLFSAFAEAQVERKESRLS